jgi:hypothetical protein
MSKKVLTVGEILVEIVATTKGDGFREPQPLVGPFPQAHRRSSLTRLAVSARQRPSSPVLATTTSVGSTWIV